MRRAAAALLLASILVPAAAAATTKTPAFGLRAVGNPKRGYFIYTLEPGGLRSGAVIISNAGTAPGTVKLFTADATTGQTSGTVYLTDQRPVGAGSWITLDKTTLTLAPGAHRRVGFTVRTPNGAQAGQWVGGIVAETSHRVTGPKSKQKANVQIRIRDLTIVAVQVNVPGKPVAGVAIGGVKTGGQRGFQQVITHLQNTGNTLIKPFGAIDIFDAHGARLQTLPFKMDTFLPRTTIDYPVLLKKALPPGTYRAVMRLTIPPIAGLAAKTVTAHPTFQVSKQDVQQVFTSATPQAAPTGAAGSSSSSTPWPLIAAVVGVLVVLLLVLWLVSRRRRRMPSRPATTVRRSASAEAAEEPAPLEQRTEPPPTSHWALPDEPETPSTEAPEQGPPLPPPPAPARADHEHLWEVAYDRGELGADGMWRFPHRCRTCGTELLARDVADATAQTHAR